ncbi:hypothetical protein FOZ63_021017 [Perkinsus olseni]|uniref:DDHD domain-containing protein n=1 Tax=Perkinsus olseni TaxID=32597 RepID=A0A7J6PUZ1_PEROL|nr:hypothetical protein FOZ63_021017 [Perkinsus olseni]
MLYNRGHVPEIGAPRCRSHCWRYRQLFGEKLKEDLNVTPEGVPARIELIPIEWGLSVHDSALDDQLESITLTSCGRVRTFANLAISDAFLYSQPARREGILDYVVKSMRQKYHLFCQNNPTFHPDVLSGRSAVCIVGHSLGSVIAFDLLARQPPPESGEESSAPRKSTTDGSTGHPHAGATTLPDDDVNDRSPDSPNGHVEVSDYAASDDFQLPFCPRVLFLLGSPLGLFLTIRNKLLPDGALPTCRRVFNIFHPNDCVAYRVEPLVAPELSEVPPMYIPHRGGHRLHVAVKRLHSDVGSAFSNVGSTISRWFAEPTQEQVADQERKNKIECALRDSIPNVKLNQGRRIDWVIQESVTEAASELWSAFGSHFSYWRHEDVISFIVDQLVWCSEDDKQWRDKKNSFF